VLLLALFIVLSATLAMTDDESLVNKVALLSIVFAILPTVTQLLDMIDKPKKEFTITGKCPRCQVNHEFTMTEKSKSK
jgi:hypothetical protein